MPQPHVLFVEDEELIRRIIAETLIEAGLRLTEACNGENALNFLREKRGFHLLLTDVHMPGRFSGVEVATHMRSLWPEAPVVFVTGRPGALRAFGPLGPRGRCIIKPYKPTDVLAAIRSCLMWQAS